jgi:hypothetical protein
MISSKKVSVELNITDWIILEDIIRQQSDIYFDKTGMAAESYRYKLTKILRVIKETLDPDRNRRVF